MPGTENENNDMKKVKEKQSIKKIEAMLISQAEDHIQCTTRTGKKIALPKYIMN